ncbi:MAG: DUF1513 domain-containing protein [Pseudomonadota bacterium]
MAIEHPINRRGILLGLAGTACLPALPLQAGQGDPAFVACCQMRDGSFAAVVVDIDNKPLFMEHLAARGHDTVLSPDRSLAVVFARRPGRFALVLDLKQHTRALAFAPPPDRHFYGHGFFTPDGRLLYATENDYEAERGVLGVYDVAARFQRISEIDTYGIGPHEALLMADGRTIAVANGGIVTHPDFPRQKLNLATMTPSLAYLDLPTGDLIDRATLPAHLHRLSIRHMAEAGDGAIWFGGQYEGAETDFVALVGSHRPGRSIALLDAPGDLYRNMSYYVGSVAANRDGTRIATTSPRGGVAIVWDVATRTAIETHRIADVGGVAPDRGSFRFSDGRGQLTSRNGSVPVDGIAHWDNHLTAIAIKT